MFRPRSRPSLEIVAVFEGAVLDVRHLLPKRARAAATTLGGVGGVLLVAGIVLFLSETLGQQSAWDEYERATAQAASAGRASPGVPASSWVGLALSLGTLGVVSLAAAFVKASDWNPWEYTIGEGPNAVFATPPVDLQTPDAFVLARLGETGAAGLRFTSGMTGEIVVNGRQYTLQEWIDEGWTVAELGAFGTTLPAGARCRLQHGRLVFHIAVVDGARVSAGRFEVDRPFWAISAASFVGLGSLLVLAHLAAPASGQLDLEDHARGRRFVGYVQQPPVVRMPSAPRPSEKPKRLTERPAQPRRIQQPVVPVPAPDDAAVSSPSVPATRRGARGSSRSRANNSSSSVLGARAISTAGALMARGTGPTERAAKAGILAYVDTSVLDNEHARAFSPGADDKAMWQAMKDSDPMTTSIAGLGLIGKGRGGGPGSTDGMVDGKAEAEAAEPRSLVVRIGRATVRGPRTPTDVRAFAVKHVRALRRCYDQGVDDDAELRGRVTLDFEVDAAGHVVSARVARGRFADPTVTDCMARAARAWSLPVTDAQRRSRVSLPITLSPG